MEELRWIDRREMNRPILVVALKGLFDAAEAATAGVDLLIAKHDASLVAEIDPASFFNFAGTLDMAVSTPYELLISICLAVYKSW